jgi:hypothetical protein
MRKSVSITLIIVVLLVVSIVPASARFRGSVWIGPGWGPGWGPVYPAYPYYAPPPVIVQQAPDVYVQPLPQPETQQFWYFCRNPEGYYPYVKQCPNGWQRVVPSPAPQDNRKE